MQQLAPVPDFRYVGLVPGGPSRAGFLAGVVGGVASAGIVLGHGLGGRPLVLSALAAGMVAFVWARARAVERADARAHHLPSSIAIVPWGVLVEDDAQPRVLRWAAVRSVNVETRYGRDTATSTTLSSIVTIETERETFTGRAYGAVPIERLLAHLDAYAQEQSHSIALDLDGVRPGEGPVEPDCEVLLSAARDYLGSSPGSSRLDLPACGYRSTALAPTERTVTELRRILRDRAPRAIDPRPFAAVIAAELRASELVDDLLALVQSPHPLVAAVAKQAARKLGASMAKAGTLEEVAPFLLEEDARALAAWGEREG
jgi:hypothetical protein